MPAECPKLAENCLLLELYQGPLLRMLPLKSYTLAAEFDPKQAMNLQ